jgi:polysaccharide biosynthesis protein PelG
MAGIGFQLRTLFNREGIAQRMQAVAYASLVTVGPMICCMAGMIVIYLLMAFGDTPYQNRELFQSGASYAFAFSFMVTSPISLFITRSVSDRLYTGRNRDLLPSFYGSLQLTLSCAAVPALILLIFSPLALGIKIALIVMYMALCVVWIEVVYISAMKAYRSVALAFFIGILLAVGLVWLLIRSGNDSAAWMFTAMAVGFTVTAGMLLVQIERFFRLTEQTDGIYEFLGDLRLHSSLLGTGLFTGLCMFEHQIAQWVVHGQWIGGSFRVTPMYDVAVYYAVLSVMPTLVWFVVSVETAFYPKYRQYFDLVLTNGTIGDIDQARRDLERVLVSELSKLMGVQFAFSIFAIAAGINFLPYIGFTSLQIDTYNILVMAFYVYVMTSIVLLLLLYFDDRKGALGVSALFLALNVIASALLTAEKYQGLSLFLGSFPTLFAALGRLLYRTQRLHYITFSAQPLVVRQKRNRSVRK